MAKKTNFSNSMIQPTKKKTNQGCGRNSKKSKIKKYRGQGGPKRRKR